MLNLKRDLLLLIQSPKEYLYSFKYSKKNIITMQAFDPKSYDIAEKLKNEIIKRCPSIKLYLIGATGLKIDGRGDIDFFATIPNSGFKEAISQISGIFGNTSKKKMDGYEWNVIYHGYPVELVLTKPENKQFRSQVKLFKILKSNKIYLNRYRMLKRNSIGVSEREYTRRRMEYFNKILRENR